MTLHLETTGVEVTDNRRVNKRNHGMRLTDAIANEHEGRAVVDAIVAKSATKVMVGGRSVFAEFPTQKSFARGVESATKTLKRKVSAMNVAYVDVAHEVARDDVVRVLHGYTEDQLCVAYDPQRRKRNKPDLAVLASTSAKELVATGVVAPNRYALTMKTQADLGLILNCDGARRRMTPGEKITLSFVIADRQVKHIIRVPNIPPLLDDDATKQDVDAATTIENDGFPNVDVSRLTFVANMIAQCNKCAHYWFWSRLPSTGKTTNMRVVSRFAFAMITRYHNGFFDHVDPQAQIVFIDEYCNGTGDVAARRLPMSDLNLLCDGGYRFNVKNKNPVELIDPNPLVVIFSNKPPEEAYTVWDAQQSKHVPNTTELTLLHARFNVIEIEIGECE